jgi:Cullin family
VVPRAPWATPVAEALASGSQAQQWPRPSCPCLQAFYDNRTKNRRLAWIYSLGSVTIKGNFDARPVEMLCSTSFHAAVLLQFNDSALCCSLASLPIGQLSWISMHTWAAALGAGMI